MANRGMFSTTDLRPLLAERDIKLSPSQTYRLVAERPERLTLTTLMALLDILGCTMEDLIEPVATATTATRRARKTTASGRAVPADDAIGELRPKRARIITE
ncbi:helix-turn-helix domain-containing protein [Kitasatospora sp. NPDC058201]|uniref:helix-turn-helix domain-containing protein n=1 Tax=unclassified Kitasatospora TaxID=2633591 RepID=UPI0036518CD6